MKIRFQDMLGRRPQQGQLVGMRDWTLVLTGKSANSRTRVVRVPRTALIVLIVLTAASLGGISRLVFFAGKYAYAEMGLDQLRKEHETLLSKQAFLGKLSREQRQKLDTYAKFEDFLRQRYGMNIIDEEVRKVGVGGRPDAEVLAASLLNVPVVRIADSVKFDADALLRRARLQNATFGQVVNHARRLRDRWAQVPSAWPAKGRVTSKYGQRIHPVMGFPSRHTGIDIANHEWTPVYTTADGIASFVGRKNYYGVTVDIEHHSNTYTTRYAHLVQAAVVEGQLLRRGDLLGYMGRTGRTTGPHLHYEVRKSDQAVDPMEHIVPVDVVVD